MNKANNTNKANNALRELDLDELNAVFGTLMSTDHIFWDLLDYVIANDESSVIAYEYMIDKLLNDCSEEDILNEIH